MRGDPTSLTCWPWSGVVSSWKRANATHLMRSEKKVRARMTLYLRACSQMNWYRPVAACLLFRARSSLPKALSCSSAHFLRPVAPQSSTTDCRSEMHIELKELQATVQRKDLNWKKPGQVLQRPSDRWPRFALILVASLASQIVCHPGHFI